jgi:polyhydroxyalkanoate synthase
MTHPLYGLPLLQGLVQSQLLSWPIGLRHSPLCNATSLPAVPPTLPAAYLHALHQESMRRSHLFSQGVLRYRHSPHQGGEQLSPHHIWHENLHFYPSSQAIARRRPLILCIPSLVNKHYILDLKADASFIEHLNALGFDCLLIKWPIPSEQDATKNLADYVIILLELLQAHWDRINRPLIGLGYCMGGIIALALAQLFPMVKGLALLATPWDYQHYPLAHFSTPQQTLLTEWIDEAPLFSSEALQMLLYFAHPYRLYQRFSRFANETNEEVIASFVALEHWANDGIPITRAIARESLLEWPQQNPFMQQQWKVAGERITPQRLTIPTLIAIPMQDHIVPATVSEPLAASLPHATLIRPQAGHVGMIAGLKRHSLWQPLGEWLSSF